MKHSYGPALGLCLVLASSLTGGAPSPDPALDARLAEAKALVRATEYEAALERIEAVLASSREHGDRRQEAEAMLAMGLALGESGAWPRGLEQCLEARALFGALGLPREEARARLALARAYQAIGGERARAQGELARAEAVFERLGDSLHLAEAQTQRSLLALRAGRLQPAIDEATRALARLRALAPDDDVLVATVRALSAVAYAQHQLGQLEPALASYQELLTLAWRVDDQRQVHFAYCNRAEIRWQMGEARPAEEDLRRAIAGWESSRARIRGTADQRADFLVAQVAAYDRLIRYLADTSRGKEAFEIAERFHARSLLETLAAPPLPALAGDAPELWQERQKSIDELGRLALASGGRDGAGPQVTAVENRLQAIETRLSGRRNTKGAVIEPPTIAQIHAGLRPGEALVAYWLTAERIFAWVVTGDDVDFVQIPVPSEDLAAAIGAYLEPMRSPRRAEDAALRHLETSHLETGQRLYRWLIGSLPKKVLAARRLIVVPDGALHNLPFESLIRSCAPAAGSEIHAPYRGCRFLGLEMPIVYSSSAGVLLSLRERHRQRAASAARPLLALAPELGSLAGVETPAELRSSLRARSPLLHTRDEVRRITGLVAGASLRLAEQASENHLKSEAGSYRLLHLATHGLVSDESPMSSGLLLAAGAGDDGLLQAHEVIGLELAADLVTLSACRTGRGAVRRGEGVIGLSRAFLTAGASSVVVSLWDVDDRSTPILMEELYRQIAQGVPIPEAMLAARRRLFEENGEAQLVWRSRPLAWAHPRFWASFVVIGAE